MDVVAIYGNSTYVNIEYIKILRSRFLSASFVICIENI